MRIALLYQGHDRKIRIGVHILETGFIERPYSGNPKPSTSWGMNLQFSQKEGNESFMKMKHHSAKTKSNTIAQEPYSHCNHNHIITQLLDLIFSALLICGHITFRLTLRSPDSLLTQSLPRPKTKSPQPRASNYLGGCQKLWSLFGSLI